MKTNICWKKKQHRWKIIEDSFLFFEKFLRYLKMDLRHL